MLLVPPDLARRTGPDWRTAIRGLLLRALVPGVALWWLSAARQTPPLPELPADVEGDAGLVVPLN
jgi:hypothetical protein